MNNLLKLISCGILAIVAINNNSFSACQNNEHKNNNEMIFKGSEIREIISNILENIEFTVIYNDDVNDALKISRQSPLELSHHSNLKKFMENRENKYNAIKNILLKNNINIDKNKYINNVIDELYRVHFMKTDDINKLNFVLDITKAINIAFKKDIQRTLKSLENIILQETINKIVHDSTIVNNIIHRLQADKQYIQNKYYFVNHLFSNDEQLMKLKEKIKDIIKIALDYMETEQECLEAIGYDYYI